MKRILLVVMAAVLLIAAIRLPIDMQNFEQDLEVDPLDSQGQNKPEKSSVSSAMGTDSLSLPEGENTRIPEFGSSAITQPKPDSSQITGGSSQNTGNSAPSGLGTSRPTEIKPPAAQPSVSTPASSAESSNKPVLSLPQVSQPTAGSDSQDSGTNLSYAEQVVELVNAERVQEGLKPLSLNQSVQAAALVRAKETEASFSHTRPNGSNFSTALTEQGVRYRSSGENIAWGQRTPEQVMQGWMNSSGHRANILSSKYTEIGVGYYRSASGVNYWTQLFIG